MKFISPIFLGFTVGVTGSFIMLLMGWETFPAAINVLTVILGIVSIVTVVSWIGSLFTHLGDLEYANGYEAVIPVEKEVLDEVKALAADGATGLPEQLLALQQDNNPVTHYMSLVNDRARNVASAKRRLAAYRASIAARARGPFSLVVKMIGSEP